ncbi:endolytic transglycosylase MltG [Branchiibius sp. NY16-3462-2]|uniref:endolytic transglycosylase MltG n=1 Tax=Branchiibius sp. NY16-3462-2 TaxID=1807500 RepID=UPI0007924554|nr:endolytic transglycosylase MltG [Branchiibius sp. NY16-3462-2]KYH44290.1 hypothetical protein AZH51_07020 [Branchiibius sp. NY16-3462-2]
MDEANLSESIFGSGGSPTPRGPADPAQARRPEEVSAEEPVREPLPAPAAPLTRRVIREREEAFAQDEDAVPEDAHLHHPAFSDQDPHLERSKVRARRGCLAILLVLALLLAGAFFAVKNLGGSLFSSSSSSQESTDYTGNGSGSVQIVVRKGDSGAAIGETLEKAGVVKSAGTFAVVAGSTPGFTSIQPGTYTMRKQMSSAAAASLMLEPGTRDAGAIVREGLWNSEIFALLSKETGVPVAQYQKVTGAQVGLPADAKGNLTGWLFPSTYQFAPGTTAVQQLKTMVDLTKTNLKSVGIDPDNAQRTLIIASLVQGEADPAKYGGKVARVIDNRLNPAVDKGQTNGLLGLDSTVSFAEGKRSLTNAAAARESTSPYNTYRVPGLPPGPIGNPGLVAIKAAQNPTPGPWLYFVTVNTTTGETLFSTTLEQFNADTEKFRQFCADNPGKC